MEILIKNATIVNHNESIKANILIKDDKIKVLLKNALTDQINDRELFMKGIDTSYYYEEEWNELTF